MQTLNWSRLSPAERRQALRRPLMDQAPRLQDAVNSIINRVRHAGDAALLDYTLLFDGVDLQTIRVDADEIKKAYGAVSDSAMAAIIRAKEQITAFHKPQRPLPILVETAPGVRCWKRPHPIDSVGLYVPGGSAPLVSTVLMLAVPSEIASCPTRILCTPPRGGGTIDPHILVAADLCGLSDIFAIGGAQAIAAMAYGTQTVPKVDKVFGPGNAWVTQAKIAVSQDPDGAALDMPAGPSEVMVVVDHTTDAEFAAADLLSQAEHGEDSQVVLVSMSATKTREIISQTLRLLAMLDRKETIVRALEHARFVDVTSESEAMQVVDGYAPEHLILQQQSPGPFAERVRNAGSVFIGPWTPESIGDYASGTNHVLPTYGFARSYSGLGTESFMKYVTYQELDPIGLKDIGPIVETLADMENLSAHKLAVSLRLERLAAREAQS